jgi:hypothetical protein
MALDLRQRHETTDGSRPTATALADDVAKAHPLVAFAVLAGGGDAFVGTNQRADVEGARAAAVDRFVVFGGDAAQVARVHGDITRMLTGSPALCARVRRMKRVRVDVVAAGGRLSDVGFPRAMNEGCAGVFWDQPQWPEAKIGLRAEHLAQDAVLVVHEVAHAIHHLAFSAAERKAIDAVLLPVWGNRQDADEVFAIYSEREFSASFGVDEKRAPGVYGATRRQWSDDHLFTRFVRKLYWPGKPLAGEQAPRAAAWKKFSG